MSCDKCNSFLCPLVQTSSSVCFCDTCVGNPLTRSAADHFASRTHGALKVSGGCAVVGNTLNARKLKPVASFPSQWGVGVVAVPKE